MSQFTDELDALAKRLGDDGYPTALIERASERMQAMEEEIVRRQNVLDDAQTRLVSIGERLMELTGAYPEDSIYSELLDLVVRKE